MDPNSNNFASGDTPTKQKENTLQDVFLFIGEIVGLGLVVIVFLLILNYFNIFRLSAAFPALSFLPHRGGLSSNSPTIKPSPTPPFPYNQTLAKTSLASFVRKTFQPAYVPSNIDNAPYPDPKGGAGYSWDQDSKTKISVRIDFVQNSNNIQKYTSRIQIFASASNLDANAAEKFVQTYFVQKDKRTWNCSSSPQDHTISCKASVNSSEEKDNYNILSIASKLLIFKCSIPNGSPMFNDIKQCYQ